MPCVYFVLQGDIIMGKLRMALAAYKFINNDIEHNIGKIEKALKEVSGKADLVCFGETFLQGFDSLNWNYEHDKEVAVSMDSDIMERIKALTVTYKTDLVLGYVELFNEDIYSSCVVIENGKILHNYRRISKGWKEPIAGEHYKEGTCTDEFIYKGEKLSIALCGDLWDFPERFKTDGALIWPIYVNFDKKDWEEYEHEYAEQAALAAKEAYIINSLSDDPVSIGGAFHVNDGVITNRVPYEAEDVLILN